MRENDLLIMIENQHAALELNRPTVLNALSLNMMQGLRHILKTFEERRSVDFVMIDGAGDRAFCAGGDVKKVTQISRDIAKDYFEAEYTLNLEMSRHKIPAIAWMDGIVMGGGAGIAFPCQFRVVSERALFAMPEVKIGFFPDVGGTYYMQKWPGDLGLFVALTGMHIHSPVDMMYLGLATHYIPLDRTEECRDFLKKTYIFRDDLEQVLNDFSVSSMDLEHDPGPLQQYQDIISDILRDPDTHELRSFDDIAWIITNHSHPYIQKHVAPNFQKAAPSSLYFTYQYYTQNLGKSLEEILRRDLASALYFLDRTDFREGVRAALVTKASAKWSPLNREDIDQFLMSLDERKDRA